MIRLLGYITNSLSYCSCGEKVVRGQHCVRDTQNYFAFWISIFSWISILFTHAVFSPCGNCVFPASRWWVQSPCSNSGCVMLWKGCVRQAAVGWVKSMHEQSNWFSRPAYINGHTFTCYPLKRRQPVWILTFPVGKCISMHCAGLRWMQMWWQSNFTAANNQKARRLGPEGNLILLKGWLRLYQMLPPVNQPGSTQHWLRVDVIFSCITKYFNKKIKIKKTLGGGAPFHKALSIMEKLNN